MNHKVINKDNNNEEMSVEYDFSKGVRGKHYQSYKQGYEVVVHKADGSTETRPFALPEGTVVLEPDVRSYFSTSEAVNRALRGLIALIPSSQRQPS
jgi:hypothetical protein